MEFPYLEGTKVFIRTITYHYTGEVVEVSNGFVHLKDAAWIADSGRWATALETGSLEEVEPYPNGVAVSCQAIVDVCLWAHDLPRKQK